MTKEKIYLQNKTNFPLIIEKLNIFTTLIKKNKLYKILLTDLNDSIGIVIVLNPRLK